MTVFNTSLKRYALSLHLQNPWWLSGASIDLDLQNGRYYDSSLAAGRQSLAWLLDYVSISRASAGYAKTSNGTLQAFASDLLRMTDLGLLIEDARTNLCLQSEALDNSTYWTTTNMSVTANQATAPNGQMTAYKCMATVNNATSVIGGSDASNVFTNTIGASYTASIYIKEGSGNTWVFIWMTNDNDSMYAGLYVNINTGAFGTTFAAGGGTLDSYSIETMADGWYRLIITAHFSASSATMQIQVTGPRQGDNNINSTLNDFFYYWGAQIEQGSFATSYIPTTTATATRAADAVTISGALQTVIAASAGSLLAQLDGTAAGFAANAVDSNGINLLGFDASNHALASLVASLATANTANRTSRDKLALAWSGAGRSLVLNGGTVASDANAQTPSSTLRLGGASGTNNIYGYVERLVAWNSKLADATLQALTTP